MSSSAIGALAIGKSAIGVARSTRYVDRITPFFKSSANYVKTVGASLEPIAQLQDFIARIPSEFDIDYAVGAQLDIVGEWVGRSREIPVPVLAMWFSLDDRIRGLDAASWYVPGVSAGATITSLDDATYRRLLYAKIAANSWDGTASSARSILQSFFAPYTGTEIIVQDANGIGPQPLEFCLDDESRGLDSAEWFRPSFSLDDNKYGLDASFWWEREWNVRGEMRLSYAISNIIPKAKDLAILGQNLIPLKPIGVEMEALCATINNCQVFALDVDNDVMAGLDESGWAAPIESILEGNVSLWDLQPMITDGDENVVDWRGTNVNVIVPYTLRV